MSPLYVIAVYGTDHAAREY